SLVRRTREKNIDGDWATEAAAIVDGPIASALDRQIQILTAMQHDAGRTPSVSRLPDGERFYNSCLRYHTTTPRTPDLIHETGLAQVAEISAAADSLLRREGLTRGSVGARLAEMGRLRRHLYPNTDAGRAQLLEDLNRQLDAIRA